MKSEQITLNRDFYDLPSIKQAISDFKNICTARIIDDKVTIEITSKTDIKNLKEEFCNYVLSLAKQK